MMLPVQLAMPLAMMVGAAIAATTAPPRHEPTRGETPQDRADRARVGLLDHSHHDAHVRMHERRWQHRPRPGHP
jgi:hypothetical protein